LKLTLFLTGLLSVTFTTSAAVINLASSSATTTYFGDGTTGVAGLASAAGGTAAKEILQHPSWAAPLTGTSWVSIQNPNGDSLGVTGDPGAAHYQVLPNNALYSFKQDFMLDALPLAGSLTVRADDTASVFLNDVKIFDVAPGPYPTCAQQPIGCLVGTQKTFSVADFGNNFKVGVNTIRFDVVQKAGSSYGLNYGGSFATRQSDAVPEPGSLLLLGSGLILVSYSLRKRVVK
jgi:hypothetical protein